MKLLTTLPLVAFASFASAANAATIEFDETNDSTFLASFALFNAAGERTSTANGDAVLELSARVFRGSDGEVRTNPQRLVDLDNNGAGVFSFDNDGDTSDQIDGDGGNDLLIFTFFQEVTLTGVTFREDNGNGDDFSFGKVTGDFYAGHKNSTVYPTTNEDFTGFSLAELTGSVFGFGAKASGADYRVASISYELAAVPVPATLPLLLAGFGGLAAMRRYKNA